MRNFETKSTNIKNIELLVFIIIWIAVFSVPFFQNRNENIINWERVFQDWIKLASFLILFIVNVIILVPKFLFRKKYLLFVGVLIFTIGLVAFTTITLQSLNKANTISMPPMEIGPGMPPMEFGTGMKAPMGYKPPTIPDQKSLFMIYTDYLIVAILIVVAGITVKLLSQWLNEESKRKDVEKEQLKMELALLRQQVSPHFLMNTLNNIHSLIDINSENAKDAVIQLSTLMRYLLYDTTHSHTSLKKEMEFIRSYVSLMQLRFSKKVSITIDVPENIPELQIPPMLFISFIENAFKHGVSYQTESFVYFKLSIRDNRLYCCIKNSIREQKEKPNKAYSGIGMSNIRKSLALLYNDQYSLETTESKNEFEINLNIPVHENKMYSHR